MTPASCKEFVLKHLQNLPEKYKKNLDNVLVALMTIGYQESLFKHRYQVLNGSDKKGPARGFWQMERGGGVVGDMNHPHSKAEALALCKRLGVSFDSVKVWAALETNDELATGFARLLLYTDPKALPDKTDVEGLWKCYLWNWRPGAYTRGTLQDKENLKSKFRQHHANVLKEFSK